MKVDVDVLDQDEPELLHEFKDDSNINQVILPEITTDTPDPQHVNRVQCSTSPYFHAFYKHHPCKLLVDTGATSSLVSKTFLKAAGIAIKPTRHAARQVDHSSISIEGEIHISLSYGDLQLPIDALVVDTMDCDILVGVPFCKQNDVSIHLKQEQIMIQGITIPYGAKPSNQHSIFRTESYVLRNDSSKVLFPGEFLEIHSDTLNGYNGEISIEPRVDSPLEGNWPIPSVSRVIQCTVRIPNISDEPIHLSKSQHIAQIRRVHVPSFETRT